VPVLDKEAGRELVARLVRDFQGQLRYHLSNDFSESQARTDFITPLFEALGWDIRNESRLPPDQREVSQEPLLDDEQAQRSTRPDYAFRRGRELVFYVEAKKPRIDLDVDSAPAFQARTYGVTAGKRISVLTNFRTLAIYDGRTDPKPEDAPTVARYHRFGFDELESRYDELYALLSRESVFGGAFEDVFPPIETVLGGSTFDAYFLDQLRTWRQSLAEDIARRYTLADSDLTSWVQRFINRIVFLRISEDRELEGAFSLKRLAETGNYAAWQTAFRAADTKYNSCIFHGAAEATLSGDVTPSVLRAIVQELYQPRSHYSFAVVQADVLGAIYEQFLGEEIRQTGPGVVSVESKPEVVASGGVATTPRYIADALVSRTLAPIAASKHAAELRTLRVADISCGSGTILLAAYEYLLNALLQHYLSEGVARHQGERIFLRAENDWRLTLSEKRRVLLDSIFGIDIDPQAVEVTRFSLLLKLVEDETADSLADFRRRTGESALPSLAENVVWGNSLVDTDRLYAAFPTLSDNELDRIAPLSFSRQFSRIDSEGGFSAVIGNPPYVRIQRMREYASREVDFYRSQESGYGSVTSGSFDKYAVFVIRALQLLRGRGKLGFVMPHKFFLNESSAGLRKVLSEDACIQSIVDFGREQVFPGRTTYTCIVTAEKSP